MLNTNPTAIVWGELVKILYIFITNRTCSNVATSSTSVHAWRFTLCCSTRYFNSNTQIPFREHTYVLKCASAHAVRHCHEIFVECKMVSIFKFNVWFQGHRMINMTFDFESQLKRCPINLSLFYSRPKMYLMLRAEH